MSDCRTFAERTTIPERTHTRVVTADAPPLLLLLLLLLILLLPLLLLQMLLLL